MAELITNKVTTLCKELNKMRKNISQDVNMKLSCANSTIDSEKKQHIESKSSGKIARNYNKSHKNYKSCAKYVNETRT